MKTAFLVAGAGLLGWFLLKDQIHFAATGETADTGTPATPATSNTAPTNPGMPALLKSKAAKDAFLQNGQMGFDHWNFYASQLLGGRQMPSIDQVFPGVDPSTLMTADAYWAGVSGVV